MTLPTILLLIVSLLVLLLGGYLWSLTSSRSIFVNAILGSACMLVAAYHSASHRQVELAIMLPFFTTMLFGGRAMGTWWRSRQENDLRLPAQLMAAVAALSLTATISTYLSL
jgi:peptidoglycan/LPS O-acetylase OafA/YrhL